MKSEEHISILMQKANKHAKSNCNIIQEGADENSIYSTEKVIKDETEKKCMLFRCSYF